MRRSFNGHPDEFSKPKDGSRMPAAPTGNASNPSQQASTDASSGTIQLIDKKGEKYLREIASIEDLPDVLDEQAAEEIAQEKRSRD